LKARFALDALVKQLSTRYAQGRAMKK